MIIINGINSFISRLTPSCVSNLFERIRLAITSIFHSMRQLPQSDHHLRDRNVKILSAETFEARREGTVDSLIGDTLQTFEQRTEALKKDLSRSTVTIFGRQVKTPEKLREEYKKNGIPIELYERLDLVCQQGVAASTYEALVSKYSPDGIPSSNGMNITLSHNENGYEVTILNKFNLIDPTTPEKIVKRLETETTITFELQEDGTYKDYRTIKELST